jgi:hypothetical protein
MSTPTAGLHLFGRHILYGQRTYILVAFNLGLFFSTDLYINHTLLVVGESFIRLAHTNIIQVKVKTLSYYLLHDLIEN